MKPSGRVANPKFILTVSFAVIAAVGITATILLVQDNPDERRQAAEPVDAAVQFELGVKYALGRGVEQDHVEAARWYRKAAEQGHAGAQFNLGLMYALGRGVPKDKAAAAHWMLKAVEPFNVGVLYDNDRGLLPNKDAEAVSSYQEAAEQGDADAQFKLGVLYAKGEGVEQDDAEAARWYRKAAEQGHGMAQIVLMVRHAKGEGVLKDDAAPVRWFREAAEQGDAAAQAALGAVYAGGSAVPKDYVLAHMWTSIAIANGNKEAGEFRDKLERDMPCAEISRATEWARACMDSDYRDCQQ